MLDDEIFARKKAAFDRPPIVPPKWGTYELRVVPGPDNYAYTGTQTVPFPPEPTVRYAQHGPWTLLTVPVAGAQYFDRDSLIKGIPDLTQGETILYGVDDNEHDPTALIIVNDDCPIGWFPKSLKSWLIHTHPCYVGGPVAADADPEGPQWMRVWSVPDGLRLLIPRHYLAGYQGFHIEAASPTDTPPDAEDLYVVGWEAAALEAATLEAAGGPLRYA